MKSLRRIASLIAALAVIPSLGSALSVVFDGDPVSPSSGLPYEILPGFPLIQPGLDGILGTPDDTINPAITGDIDMVVRSGSPAATAIIGPPTVHSGPLPSVTAGSTAAGGTTLAFTVFLSDGITSVAAPYGNLLAAADMDGIPVIVAAFADLDNDGFIGPTDVVCEGSVACSRQVRELEPVGRGVALFSGGVARGSLSVSVGRPAGQGGLKIVLGALSLTGPFDPNVFSGNIPSGPAIASALPFLPQRDLSRLLRDRAVPVGPATTMQSFVQFAEMPRLSDSPLFALPTDGSSATNDVALAISQPSTRAALYESLPGKLLPQMVGEIVLGTDNKSRKKTLRLVPVDRYGNPADPALGNTFTLTTTGPLLVRRPSAARQAPGVTLTSTNGKTVGVEVPKNTPDGVSGSLMVESNGVVVAAVAYRVDVRANTVRPDVTVPSRNAPTIQAAINTVTDRNGDGAMVVAVKPGVYRENVSLNRSVVVRGYDCRRTLIQGDGGTAVVSVGAANSTLQDLTVVGGTTGVSVSGSTALLSNVRAFRNLGAGISVAATGAELFCSEAEQNGGPGVTMTAANQSSISQSRLLDNSGVGGSLLSLQSVIVDNNWIGDNGQGGLAMTSVNSSQITNNRIANNFTPAVVTGDDVGQGIGLISGSDDQITGNVSVFNDGDAMHFDQTSNLLVSGNNGDTNQGYCIYARRGTNDDYAAAAGIQTPRGDNICTNNKKGDVFIRTK